jgi:hypothetical protein
VAASLDNGPVGAAVAGAAHHALGAVGRLAAVAAAQGQLALRDAEASCEAAAAHCMAQQLAATPQGRPCGVGEEGLGKVAQAAGRQAAAAAAAAAVAEAQGPGCLVRLGVTSQGQTAMRDPAGACRGALVVVAEHQHAAATAAAAAASAAAAAAVGLLQP